MCNNIDSWLASHELAKILYKGEKLVKLWFHKFNFAGPVEFLNRELIVCGKKHLKQLTIVHKMTRKLYLKVVKGQT